jgi:hypothetical protein
MSQKDIPVLILDIQAIKMYAYNIIKYVLYVLYHIILQKM